MPLFLRPQVEKLRYELQLLWNTLQDHYFWNEISSISLTLFGYLPFHLPKNFVKWLPECLAWIFLKLFVYLSINPDKILNI